MQSFTAEHPPRQTLLLGYAGLLPFIGGALGVWLTPLAWRPTVLSALLDYAAIILAFMGAIHWGLAMRAERKDTLALTQLGLSVLPAGLGWLAIVDIIPAGLAVALLLFGFVALYLADLRAVRLELAPRWYPALRKPLTLGVVLCLLATWLGVMLVG